MNFSLISSKDLISDDIRTAFKDMVQEELVARAPAQGVTLLKAKEPEQLEFNFDSVKKVLS